MFWSVHSKPKIFCIIFIILTLLFISCAKRSPLDSGQSAQMIIIDRHEILAASTPERDEQISTEFDAYIFFLFPSKKWIQEANKKNPNIIRALKIEFKEFGEAIGDRNLAIWFIDEKGMPDTNRSLDFARIFNLDVNSGPYIVYVNPKHKVISEIILHYSPHSIDKTMSQADLRGIASNPEFIEKFEMDFSELGADQTLMLLNVLKGQLRGDSINISKLRSSNRKYYIKYKVHSFGKSVASIGHKFCSAFKLIEAQYGLFSGKLECR